jgi:hypothetical protein
MNTAAMVVTLDHNYHLRRQYRVSADGLPLLHKGYNARTKHEFVRGVKEVKTYPYVEPILALAQQFAFNPNSVPTEFESESFNPQTIAPTVRAVTSTPSQQLLTEHHSRFAHRNKLDK